MNSELAEIVRTTGIAPLCWAGGTLSQDYLNLGDALSPIMVAMLSGRPVCRVPFRSETPRLAAVGTIGQNIAGGRVWYWGTGCSNYATRGAGVKGRFSPDPDTEGRVCATRGPLTAALLGAGRLATTTFGDPVWLLPRFYRPRIEKRWDLGIVLHLSQLADRSYDCHPLSKLLRYRIPQELSARIKLFNTVTPISLEGIRMRIDEILACKRIVSTSLHGMVLAESYGIPCLYFPPSKQAGPQRTALDFESGFDLRMLDFQAGLGRNELALFGQPQREETDWEAVIRAIDDLWEPAIIDDEGLISALPMDLNPLSAPDGRTIWDHPMLRGLELAHDAAQLRTEDRKAAETNREDKQENARQLQLRLHALNLPMVVPSFDSKPVVAPRMRLTPQPRGAVLPLTWVAGGKDTPEVNVGDALSPFIVAAMSGLPLCHANTTSPMERMAAVGTIAQLLRNGIVHIWGSGLDAKINPLKPDENWSPPPDTLLQVHATRGPFSADSLRKHGIYAPEVFGDPVYFLPRLWPMKDVEKTHELGVVLHLSELDVRGKKGQPKPEFIRYKIPSGLTGEIRIINMYSGKRPEDIERKISAIVSCKAILSTSLHGLVIADAYGIPGAWFGFFGRGFKMLNALKPKHRIDHRIRDLYAGLGRAEVPVYATPRSKETDWEDAIRFLQSEVEPSGFKARALFEAFPGPLSVRFEDSQWPLPTTLLSGISL